MYNRMKNGVHTAHSTSERYIYCIFVTVQPAITDTVGNGLLKLL